MRLVMNDMQQVAKQSATLRSILEDLDSASAEAIPIPNVSGTILEKVVM
jgi:hypothetical protein